MDSLAAVTRPVLPSQAGGGEHRVRDARRRGSVPRALVIDLRSSRQWRFGAFPPALRPILKLLETCSNKEVVSRAADRVRLVPLARCCEIDLRRFAAARAPWQSLTPVRAHGVIRNDSARTFVQSE